MRGPTDQQLQTIMDAARELPVEKRDLYLQRIAAMLAMRGRGHFNDDDRLDLQTIGEHRKQKILQFLGVHAIYGY